MLALGVGEQRAGGFEVGLVHEDLAWTVGRDPVESGVQLFGNPMSALDSSGAEQPADHLGLYLVCTLNGRSTPSSSKQGCDAALFVGMHARAGTSKGVMNHTISGRDYQNLWFNDVLVGETGINAALCGTWGCPVLLVTGDEATCAEAQELLGDALTTVAVKRGLGAGSARMIPPKRARELIEEGAKRALSDLEAVAPYDPGSPCEIKVEFKNTVAPDKLRFRAGVERVDERTIVSRADTWWDAWRQYYF